jgi:hypothetical protein
VDDATCRKLVQPIVAIEVANSIPLVSHTAHFVFYQAIAGPAYAALIASLKAVHDASEEEKQALEESRSAVRRMRDLQQQAEAAAATGEVTCPIGEAVLLSSGLNRRK